MKEQINIAFIGCGRVAENHYRAIQNCSSATLVALYDIQKEAGEQRAREWGVDYREIDDLLEDSAIDAIFILTPLDTHITYAKLCLEKGKDVLVEKPVSLKSDEIRSLEQLSEKYQKICMPGHSYLYLREIRRMYEKIPSGNIGSPVMMAMSEIYYMPDKLLSKYNGPTIEVLYHQLYLMIALMGEPVSVQAFSGCFRESQIPTGDELVSVNVQFSEGAVAHLFVSWAGEDETSDPWTFKLKVLGKQGGMHFSRRDFVSGSMNSKEFPLYDEMFESEVDFFVNQCVKGRHRPLSTLKEAARAADILNAIRSSIKNKTIENL